MTDAARRTLQAVEDLRRHAPDRALRLLSRRFSAAVRGAGPAHRGELWRVRGHVLRSLRHTRDAVAAYRRAERWFARAGEHRERGRCAIGLVDSLMYLGAYREAERTANRGRRLLHRAGDSLSLARLLNNEGNLHHRLDRPQRALESYRRARRALLAAGDRRGAALIAGNIANCDALLGQCAKARRGYRAAERVLSRLGFPVDALNAAYNLAYLDFLEHRHERALEGLDRVRSEARRAGVPSLAALVALDRAEILLRLGAHHDAVEEAGRAIEECGALGLRYERAKAETFAAVAEFRLGQPRTARARLEGALAAFVEEGNRVWTGEALVGMATAWAGAGNPHAAALLLGAGAAQFARAGDVEREGCAWALVARARVSCGRPAAAARALERARAARRRRPSVRLVHLVRIAAAAHARAAGDRGTARRHLRAAARAAERLAARILDEQWRASFWGEWGLPHEELSALEAESGRIDEAFEALERGRGRVLTAPTRSRRGDLTVAARSWAAAHAARERDRTTRSAGPDPFPPAATTAPGSGPLVVSSELRRELAEVRGVEVRAAQVRSGLAPGAMLLDYALYRGALGAFAVTPEGIRHLPSLASEREVRRLIHATLFALRGASLGEPSRRRPDPALDQTLLELASIVLWPALATLGSATWSIAVVPAGPLHRLPWAALPLPDGRRLCEAVDLVLVPGLRTALTGSRRPLAVDGGAPLIVAADAGELVHVAREAEAVSRSFPGARVLAGPEATADRFLELAPSASWIHFAGHGRFEAEAPQWSGLSLADRWVRAEELSGLRLRTSWVSLSACQTARALVRPGEEWFGLARSLLVSGAEAVIAAQWDIEDEAASWLMTGFYRHVANEFSVERALRIRQAEAVATGKHPLEWAGFVTLGRPPALVPPNSGIPSGAPAVAIH